MIMEGFYNLIYIFVICVINSAESTQCKWPEKVCVPIHNCEKINLQLKKSDLTKSEIFELQRTQCGFRNGIIYVCCKSSLPQYGNCGPYVPKRRIVNGRITQMNQFPWTALLIRRISEDFPLHYKCGGTLLNDRYILTSAHCIAAQHSTTNEIRIKKLYKVRLGEWNKTTTKLELNTNDITKTDSVQQFDVEKYIIHKDYEADSRKNDIALLKLVGKVKLTHFVTPICLPDIRHFVIPERKNSLTVMGWGKTENGKLSDVKLYASITLVPKEKCEEILQNNVGYTFAGHLNEEQFCAGGYSDTCVGDSGGPVVTFDETKLSYNIVGIVTYGANPCGANGLPGIYTNISMYFDWILQNMEH